MILDKSLYLSEARVPHLQNSEILTYLVGAQLPSCLPSLDRVDENTRLDAFQPSGSLLQALRWLEIDRCGFISTREFTPTNLPSLGKP